MVDAVAAGAARVADSSGSGGAAGRLDVLVAPCAAVFAFLSWEILSPAGLAALSAGFLSAAALSDGFLSAVALSDVFLSALFLSAAFVSDGFLSDALVLVWALLSCLAGLFVSDLAAGFASVSSSLLARAAGASTSAATSAQVPTMRL